MDTLPLNLRRLIFWHHKSAKEFAETLGTTERTVSAWLNGKREPSYSMAMKMARIYGVDPSLFDGDPVKFGTQLADPKRDEHVLWTGFPLAEKERRRAALKPVDTPPESVSTSG